jgi:putative oxidoreductase
VAGISEIGGGLMLASGLLTPAAALAIAVLMLAAIWTDLRHQGYYVRNGGAEYAVLIWTVVIAITAIGPGRFSLDALIGWADDITGLWWALGVLGLSVVIAAVLVTVGRVPAHAVEGEEAAGDDPAAAVIPTASRAGE